MRDEQSTGWLHIRRIYAHHALHGTATFEVTPPSLQEMLERREKVLEQGMPYLLAQLDNRVVGYCYASLYRPRVAYRYTIEDSIYLEEGQSGQGLGKALLSALIERCEQGDRKSVV